MYPDKDEYAADEIYGKKMGETYGEADQRKKEEYNWRMDGVAKERRDLESTKQRQDQDDLSRRVGGASTTSRTPKRASSGAKIAKVVGLFSLFAAFMTFNMDVTYAPFLGLSVPIIALIVGVLGLALGYAAERVSELMGLAGLVIVYLGGRTPEGFQFSAVSLQTWGLFALIVAGGFLIAYLFRRQ